MSERIREAAVALIGALAEQAGAGWDHKYHWYVGSETMQKFAELIVAECQTALNPMLRDMISRGQAVDLIKKHFGLED